ncbi:MAG: tetratricopeptide repeat protein, partial [Candidatus Omnitrophica bacterium]|nr:tetratricopeptide repeat protein [Candidatus Omnitrophota bacterium]
AKQASQRERFLEKFSGEIAAIEVFIRGMESSDRISALRRLADKALSRGELDAFVTEFKPVLTGDIMIELELSSSSDGVLALARAKALYSEGKIREAENAFDLASKTEDTTISEAAYLGLADIYRKAGKSGVTSRFFDTIAGQPGLRTISRFTGYVAEHLPRAIIPAAIAAGIAWYGGPITLTYIILSISVSFASPMIQKMIAGKRGAAEEQKKGLAKSLRRIMSTSGIADIISPSVTAGEEKYRGVLIDLARAGNREAVHRLLMETSSTRDKLAELEKQNQIFQAQGIEDGRIERVDRAIQQMREEMSAAEARQEEIEEAIKTTAFGAAIISNDITPLENIAADITEPANVRQYALDRLAELDEKNAALYRARSAEIADDHASAAAAYEEFLEQPDIDASLVPETRKGLIEAYNNANMFSKAHHEKALALMAKIENAGTEAAKSALRAEAVNELKRAVLTDMSNSRARNELANMLSESGDLVSAAAQYRALAVSGTEYADGAVEALSWIAGRMTAEQAETLLNDILKSDTILSMELEGRSGILRSVAASHDPLRSSVLQGLRNVRKSEVIADRARTMREQLGITADRADHYILKRNADTLSDRKRLIGLLNNELAETAQIPVNITNMSSSQEALVDRALQLGLTDAQISRIKDLMSAMPDSAMMAEADLAAKRRAQLFRNLSARIRKRTPVSVVDSMEGDIGALARKYVEKPSADIFLQIAEVCRADGQNARMIAFLEQCVKTHPDNNRARVELAEAYLDIGHTDLAERLADEAVKMDPKESYAHYLLGRIYQGKGMLNEALGSYENAIETGLGTNDVYVAAEELYQLTGKVSDVKGYYERIGQILLEEGRTQKARKLFTKLIQYDLNTSESYL